MQLRFLLLKLVSIALVACATRQPITPGTVPVQDQVSKADQEYGEAVYAELSRHYSTDDSAGHNQRVWSVLQRLTEKAGADTNPWRVFILKDDTVKNAAATRGNFVFVWSGMLKAVQSDDELATVLAHEVGHVLAGHAIPSPAEEASQILVGTAELATKIGLGQYGYNPYGVDLAAQLAALLLEAILVNPESQRKELEADHIGLFLMARAGYDPEQAVAFWERLKRDPAVTGLSVAFLSSHPSSTERIEELKKYLPRAVAEFQGKPFVDTTVPEDDSFNYNAALNSENPDRKLAFHSNGSGELWRVEEQVILVHESPNRNSPKVSELRYGTEVNVEDREGRWLRISAPVRGYVRGRDLSPLP